MDIPVSTWICYVYAQELLGCINSVIDLLTLNSPASGNPSFSSEGKAHAKCHKCQTGNQSDSDWFPLMSKCFPYLMELLPLQHPRHDCCFLWAWTIFLSLSPLYRGRSYRILLIKGIGGIGHAILCLPANNSDQLFKMHLHQDSDISAVSSHCAVIILQQKEEYHKFTLDSRAGTQCGPPSASWLYVIRLLLASLGFRNISNGLFKWWHTDDTPRTNYEIMVPSHTLIKHVQKLENLQQNPKLCSIIFYFTAGVLIVDTRATLRRQGFGFNVVCFWKRPPSFLSFPKKNKRYVSHTVPVLVLCVLHCRHCLLVHLESI